MPQDNNNDPNNTAGNLDARRDPNNDSLNSGFQREERPMPNGNIPTTEVSQMLKNVFLRTMKDL
ncbi:hypothetical protein KEH51_00645 [[Brevibacterium] frigoritolerans]|uniref:Uncharacterized protein n=1 Tax=Peribacillus frigoritolerans TaxID=450367 RepID=A0A941FGE8_9BACI|nr:hypothetical protein [Peribacillus frigoritolerans]